MSALNCLCRTGKEHLIVSNLSVIKRSSTGLVHSFYIDKKSRVLPPVNYDHVILPPKEHRLLPALEIVPRVPNNRAEMKLQRRPHDFKGPETVHNRLIYKQYGLIALCGGQLFPTHIRMLRDSINRRLIEDSMFAVWRIDPPWKPVTRKSAGKKLGGGKGSIYNYVTPIKAGRVLLEVGGFMEFEFILPILTGLSVKMPVDCMPVYQGFFDEYRREQEERERNNLNPLTLEHAIKNNLAGCHQYIEDRDHLWYGRY